MKDLIEKFYTAFTNLDAEGMAECYHPNVHFEDPGFGVLKGKHAGNMWRMLLSSQKGKDFQVQFSDIKMDGEMGKAHWEAQYDFSQTGRRVHNKIDATFKFKDGKIVEHIDTFDLYSWSKQALGTTGYLMGWSGFFKKKLHAQTAKMLAKYEKENNL